MRRQRRNIGMIFQEFNLIDRLSVIDNVLTGRLGYMGNLRSLFCACTRKTTSPSACACSTASA